LRSLFRDLSHRLFDRGLQEGIFFMQYAVGFQELVVDMFSCIRLLEKVIQLAVHREEAFLMSALHIHFSGHNCIQAEAHYVPELRVRSRAFLQLLCKALVTAIHKGERVHH
jgi:hypothetical protein